MRVLLWISVVLLATPALAGMAVLQGLDRVTGRTQTFEAPLNGLSQFGTFEIVVRHCHKNPPEEPADNVAFLEVHERLGDGSRVAMFSGWMFSSSPALSSVEHPVYDVWLLDCIKEVSTEDGSGSE
jgi:hypothetical protein